MRVPTSLLREELVVEPFLGDTSHGPRYGPPRTIKARVEGRRRLVQRPGGAQLMSTATAIVRPDAPITEQSRARWNGRPFDVLEVLQAEGLTRPSHLEVLLG